MRTATLKHRVTISRDGPIANSHKTGLATVAEGVKCLILPADPRMLAARGLDLSQGYDIYFNGDANVKVGDLVTHGDKRYKISGLRPYNGISGNVDHIEAVAALQGA